MARFADVGEARNSGCGIDSCAGVQLPMLGLGHAPVLERWLALASVLEPGLGRRASGSACVPGLVGCDGAGFAGAPCGVVVVGAWPVAAAQP